jgi:hypothetical protein
MSISKLERTIKENNISKNQISFIFLGYYKLYLTKGTLLESGIPQECKKRSKSDTYDTSVRTPMTVSFGQ